MFACVGFTHVGGSTISFGISAQGQLSVIKYDTDYTLSLILRNGPSNLVFYLLLPGSGNDSTQFETVSKLAGHTNGAPCFDFKVSLSGYPLKNDTTRTMIPDSFGNYGLTIPTSPCYKIVEMRPAYYINANMSSYCSAVVRFSTLTGCKTGSYLNRCPKESDCSNHISITNYNGLSDSSTLAISSNTTVQRQSRTLSASSQTIPKVYIFLFLYTVILVF